MAIAIGHSTAADGTFSSAGATAWNAAHSVTGLTADAVVYATDATTLAQSSSFTFGSTAGKGLVIGAGTATTDVNAISATHTINNAAVAFTSFKYAVTETAKAAGTILAQWLGGSAGTTNALSIIRSGNAAFLTIGDSGTANTQGLLIGSAGAGGYGEIRAQASPAVAVFETNGPTVQFNTSAAGGALNFFTNSTLRIQATTGGALTVEPAVATPANGSTAARLCFGTTSGFGIYYGSGDPSVSAAQGSIYLRSDGSGIANRLWVNTNGSTGWTNFVTAA